MSKAWPVSAKLSFVVMCSFVIVLAMGWRSDEFIWRVLWALSADGLPSVQNTVEPQAIGWSEVRWLGDIEDPQLNESSGLAASNRQADLLWSINDSGDGANIYAMSTLGAALGRWRIASGMPVDWEAMDSFVLNGEHYLLLADVGDNFAARDAVSLIVIKEPTLTQDQSMPIAVEWRIELAYPDGPRDCEAVAVDTSQQRVLLLSKRTFPNDLYSVPLRPVAGEQVIANKIGAVFPLPRNVPGHEKLYGRSGRYQGMPTGMTLHGHRLLVTTYRDAYLYDLRDVALQPFRIPLPLSGQREAITFAMDSDSRAYVSRERKNGEEIADLFRLDFAAVAPERTPLED